MVTLVDESATHDEALRVPLTLHEAIRAAYKDAGLTQEEVASRVRALPDTEDNLVTRTKLSKWSTGEDRAPLEILPIIEQACGRPRGWILHAAGFLDGLVSTVPDAVAMDPDLEDVDRGVVLDVWRGFVERRRARRGKPDGLDGDEAGL